MDDLSSEGVWGDFALSRLVKVVISVPGKGVGMRCGKVAKGLKGLRFDFRKVAWSCAKLAYVG